MVSVWSQDFGIGNIGRRLVVLAILGIVSVMTGHINNIVIESLSSVFQELLKYFSMKVCLDYENASLNIFLD